MTRQIRAVAVVAGLAVGAMALPAVAPATAHKRFSGRLCPDVSAAQLAAAHVTAKCLPRPTQTFGSGPISSEVTAALWGDSPLSPSWMAIRVQKTRGTASLVKQAEAAFRKSVGSNGPRVKVGDLGSVSTHTYDGARHKGKLLFVDQGYDVVIDLNDDNPAASRSTIKAALVSIGKSVAAKL